MPILLDKMARDALERIRNLPPLDVAELNKLAAVHDFDEDRRICEAEYKKWLSYYDVDGYLMTDANKDPGYNASMRYVPIRLTDEEAAAFIVAEKKRLGVV